MFHLERERVIKEKRLLEATRKNLVGNSGKLSIICRVLGNQILKHTSSSFCVDTNYLKYDCNYNDEAIYEQTVGEGNLGPMIDPGKMLDCEDGSSSLEGWAFDGLRWAMHLEIVHLQFENKITLNYKGYKVYEEAANDLLVYVPNDEWEEKINILYKKAKEKMKQLESVKEAEIKEEVDKRKKSFFEALRERWGI